MTKKRLSVSVDADLVEAAQAAVEAGQAENVSAFVNEALKKHAEHHRGLAAMADAIAAYEAEYGKITDEDMEAARRWLKESAITVRPRSGRKGRGAA
jgi:Arc/MetJ-type ribon-helix-helix transcriptional regulator